VAEGDTVAARVVWRGVHKGPWRGIAPTGKRFEFRGMTFWRIRDGRIAERWAEVDSRRWSSSSGVDLIDLDTGGHRHLRSRS